MLRYILRLASLFLGFFLLFSGILIYLAFFSENKANMVHTYFPQIHAKIEFFQDAPIGTPSSYKYVDYPYVSTSKWTWTSAQWLNQSFSKAWVTLGGEWLVIVEPIPKTTIIISRDSH